MQTQAALPPSAGEADRVHRAGQGDPEAFAGLYETYLSRVFRFVAARVEDDVAAEDLTARVFMKAWDHLPRYRPGNAPFAAWLFRIARNAVIDHYRTRRPTTSFDALRAQPDPAPDLADHDPREAEQVRAALRRLTPDQREVLTLRFFDGMSTEEIGRHLGRRPGAIRALQLRGLRALAEELETEHG